MYVYFFIIDLILVDLLGAGMFYTRGLTEEYQQAMSLILMVILPVAGMASSSVATSCNYYFFSMQLTTMLSTALRRLPNMLICFLVCLAVGIANGFLYGILPGVFSAIYGCMLSIFMSCTALLGVFKNTTGTFFTYVGPRYVAMSILLMAPAPVLLNTVFKTI